MTRRRLAWAVATVTAGACAATIAASDASAGAASASTPTTAAPASVSRSQNGADSTGNRSDGIVQAPALPGAQPISDADRVYTADQSSNTVTVINPKTNKVLGTIPLGERRLDGVLGPVDTNEVNVHGLGFSRDGRYLDAISVTSNAAQVIDTSTNKVVFTTYVGRAPHEGFISPDGRELWVAVRGEDYVSVIRRSGREALRIDTEPGPSKVVFSPDGAFAYVNHLRAQVVDVIRVANHKVEARIPIPEAAGGSSDEAVSPDGRELWLGHPGTGKTTVIDLRRRAVSAVLDTGPRTNHPMFVTKPDAAYAYVTVGDLNQTLVYRRSEDGGAPQLVDRIHNSGVAPHGIWPSPDNTRVYVALQKSDSVDVIDTDTRKVIATLNVGQDPQALVYVARNPRRGGDTANLSEQGIGQKVVNLPIATRGVGGEGLANIRSVIGLEEVDIRVTGLPPNTTFTVFATEKDGSGSDALLDITSDDTGTVAEALAYVKFFANYDSLYLTRAQR